MKSVGGFGGLVGPRWMIKRGRGRSPESGTGRSMRLPRLGLQGSNLRLIWLATRIGICIYRAKRHTQCNQCRCDNDTVSESWWNCRHNHGNCVRYSTTREKENPRDPQNEKAVRSYGQQKYLPVHLIIKPANSEPLTLEKILGRSHNPATVADTPSTAWKYNGI